jgi:hypothetical protein
VLVFAFALRTVAALPSAGAGWLRWTTPLGWVEELRPFAGPQPLVLLLPAVVAAVLLVAAYALFVRRDIGRGLLPAHDTSPPRTRLLGSPVGQALRVERGGLIAWVAGVGAFALLMGVLADSVTPDVISEEVQRQLEKLGTSSVVTPSGWLGFSFVFFLLAVCLFCAGQVASLRGEEADQRLETLLALPLGRNAWLAGRLLLASAAATLVALAAGVLAWVGAAAKGADVSLAGMLGTGANPLPPAPLFLATGALAFALVPRACATLTYSLVGAAFLLELFGSLLELPGWVLALSPFHDIGLVPGEPFEPLAAAIMVALALLAAAAAIVLFRRRDLVAACGPPTGRPEGRPDYLLALSRRHALQRRVVGRAGRGQTGALGRAPALEKEALAAAGGQQREHVRRLVPLDAERVRHVAREEHERARSRLDRLVAGAERDPAREHPESLVLAPVDVERRGGPRGDRGLHEPEQPAGRLRGRLDRHPVLQEPDVLSLAGERREPGRQLRRRVHRSDSFRYTVVQ